MNNFPNKNFPNFFKEEEKIAEGEAEIGRAQKTAHGP